MPKKHAKTATVLAEPIARIKAVNDDARIALDALQQVIRDLPDSNSHGPTLILISERLERAYDAIEEAS